MHLVGFIIRNVDEGECGRIPNTAVLLPALSSPQILHGLAGDRTYTSSVRTWQLTAWATWCVPDCIQIAVCTSQRPRSASITKTSQLMLYREIIAVCSQIRTKHISTLYVMCVYIYLFIHSVQFIFHTSFVCSYCTKLVFTLPHVSAIIMIQTQAAIGVSVKGAGQWCTVALNWLIF
jgi:hypothetical protein